MLRNFAADGFINNYILVEKGQNVESSLQNKFNGKMIHLFDLAGLDFQNDVSIFVVYHFRGIIYPLKNSLIIFQE